MTGDSDPAPLVSVVLPVRDGGPFLREALESILGQTLRELELVAVDDGSTDDTRDILEAYGNADRRVRVVHQDGTGLVEALNRGCDLARAPFIARMDADDVAASERLKRQFEFLRSNDEVVALGTAIQLIDDAGRTFSTVVYQPNPDPRTVLSTNPFAHPSVVVRTEALRAAGGYRQAFRGAEDYDLWLRLAERGRLANLDAALLQYRVHEASTTSHAVRAQAISVLAAQIAACRRRAGQSDPFDRREVIRLNDLVELGMSEAEIEVAIASKYAEVATLLAEVRATRTALELLRTGRTLAPRARALSYLTEATIHRRSGDHVRAVASTLRAAVADPRRARRAARRRLVASRHRKHAVGPAKRGV